MQLVLHYDGAGFSGWQRQPDQRTVQAELEGALSRIVRCAHGGARRRPHRRRRPRARPGGRASGPREVDAGVALRRALNGDAARRHLGRGRARDARRVSRALQRHGRRYSTTSARTTKHTLRFGGAGSGARAAGSTARSRAEAAALDGEHFFRAFAVRGTAPAHGRSPLSRSWRPRGAIARVGSCSTIEANRFLHHMVRFLVGTMLDVASGRRPPASIAALLAAADNQETSPPAPAHALFLDAVRYPGDLYLEPA